MQVVEIFRSIQGEGTLIGTPMVFIRLWGCDAGCVWCDTRYSWAPEFKDTTERAQTNPEELATQLAKDFPNGEWFNFTGGEPTLWSKEIIETIEHLTSLLPLAKTAIQTNGKKWHEALFRKMDKVCMDFKCPESGEESDLGNLKQLRPIDEAKFVVASENDLQYIHSVFDHYQTSAEVIIQPVLWSDEPLENYYDQLRTLVEDLNKRPIKNARVLPQLHQLLWRDQNSR